MAFQRLTNTNTYAPSMKPGGSALPSALSGLLDRVDQNTPATSPKPFDAARVMYGGTSQMDFSMPRPKPEARQSVWQYPRSVAEASTSFVRSLMSPPASQTPDVPAPIPQTPEEQEPAPVKPVAPVEKPSADEQKPADSQAQSGQYPWADFQPSVIPIPELERLQYFNMTPVQRRGLV